MSLPKFNSSGDLPPGVYCVSWAEVVERWGTGGPQRASCTRRTGCLRRFVIFGSYVTTKSDPNDVDVVLVMDDAFRLEDCPVESRGLFEHAIAQARFGASVFWIRPALLIGETLDEFIAYWQIKRDGSQRGIVDVRL